MWSLLETGQLLCVRWRAIEALQEERSDLYCKGYYLENVLQRTKVKAGNPVRKQLRSLVLEWQQWRWGVVIGHCTLTCTTLVLMFSPTIHSPHLSTQVQVSSWLLLPRQLVDICYNTDQSQASETAVCLLASVLMIFESSSCQMLDQLAVCPKRRYTHSLLFLPGMTVSPYSASPLNHTSFLLLHLEKGVGRC